MKVREHAKQLPKELIKDITLKSAERSRYLRMTVPIFLPNSLRNSMLLTGWKKESSGRPVKGKPSFLKAVKKRQKKRQRRPGESSKNEGVKMRIVLLNRVETVELKEIHKQNVKLIYELKQKKR